jgi:hypothetical protein
MISARRRIGAALALGVLFFSMPAHPDTTQSPSPNLILNGNLAKGSGEQPDHWRTEAWVNDPTAFHYAWIHRETGGPGELEVEALKPNDARWMQTLTLSPGWYRFSAEVRTDNVGTRATGATISIMEDGAMSPDIRGTTGWQRVALYLKVGSSGADVEVGLRVGGFGSLNTGKAFFRDVQAERLSAPPPGATPVYDLSAIRKAAQPQPVGHPITLIAAFIVLLLISVQGWRMFAAEPAPPPAAPAVKPQKPRAKARR